MSGLPGGVAARDASIPTLRDAMRHVLRLVTLLRSYWRDLATGSFLGLGIALASLVPPYVAGILQCLPT